uniref:Uncharacterized protein n=1 Tax=Timema tahoe TaxID=61484 RepID=A0A7R9FMH2_9NEOP|nr:unnamed protein product [Timema tahoe]
MMAEALSRLAPTSENWMVATAPYLILPLTITNSSVIFRCFQNVQYELLLQKEALQTRATRDVRDLYELLLQKEALENRLGQHEVVRKSNRSPSLRLRFGRRADPSIAAAAFADHSSIEVPSEN